MDFNFLNGMFGSIEPGMCHISMNGDIAIKTSSGYKTYNVNTGRLVNCNSFVLEGMEGCFFVIPTKRVAKGDIILANGKPRCVIEVRDNAIETFCYEDSTISTIVPEHQMFMGKTYFYGKIVSLFGNMKGKGGKNIMKFMMMRQMFGGDGGKGGLGDKGMMMLMMMNGGMKDMFDGMLDFDDDDDEDEAEEEN